jgi:dTDP-glucose 4,6-dehydratase
MQNPLSADLDHVLEHTADLWREMRGERMFITGGTGFFGCWLLESFVWANARLNLGASAIVLTRNPEAFRVKAPHLAEDPALTLQAGNLRTCTFQGTASTVIHAATETSSDPAELYRDNIEGTDRALQIAGDCGAKRFLFTSSGAVYGKQPPDLPKMPEEYPGLPSPQDSADPYGHSKRVSEEECRLFARFSPCEFKIARCFAFVGPYLPLNINFAIGNFIRDAIDKTDIDIKGDGTPYRSYLYAADLAIWLWTILFRGKSCRPYNVGSENAICIADLARKVVEVCHPNGQVKIAKTPEQGVLPQRYVPDVARAKTELGLDEWVPLDTAIRKTYEWYVR